jgi:hypothetical protein
MAGRLDMLAGAKVLDDGVFDFSVDIGVNPV